MGEYIKATQTSIGRASKQLLDTQTGELIEAEQILKRVYGSRPFWKLYLTDFLSVLGIFESKQLNVLIHILEHTHQSTNTFIGTYRSISKDCEVSLDTVRRAMQKLQIAGFMKKIQNGVYFISPDILMKGNDGKKAMLIQYYNTALRDEENEAPKKQENTIAPEEQENTILPEEQEDTIVPDEQEKSQGHE